MPKALRVVRAPVAIKGFGDVGFDGETPDDEWLAEVGSKNWAVITQDRKFHKNEVEIAAVKAHSVRCFYLHGGSESSWATLRSLVIAFPRIVKIAGSERPPFIYHIQEGRLWRQEI